MIAQNVGTDILIIKKSSSLHLTPGVGVTLASFPPQHGCTRHFIGRAHIPTPVMCPVLVMVVRHKEEMQIMFLCIKLFSNQ